MIKYTVSKTSVLGIIIFFVGLLFTIQGISIRYNLTNVNNSYEKAELKNGRYVECDITKEQLIGAYYAERSGINKYSPYCDENALSSEQTYIMAISENLDYFVPLVMSQEYQSDFKQILNSDKVYHVFGKIEKFENILHYDTISECMGSNNMSELNRMISTKYQIKIVDIKNERKKIYKGFLLLISGLLVLFSTIEKGSG